MCSSNSPLIRALASELIKWLVGFWLDAMAWRVGWTPYVIHTQQDGRVSWT